MPMRVPHIKLGTALPPKRPTRRPGGLITIYDPDRTTGDESARAEEVVQPAHVPSPLDVQAEIAATDTALQGAALARYASSEAAARSTSDLPASPAVPIPVLVGSTAVAVVQYFEDTGDSRNVSYAAATATEAQLQELLDAAARAPIFPLPVLLSNQPKKSDGPMGVPQAFDLATAPGGYPRFASETDGVDGMGSVGPHLCTTEGGTAVPGDRQTFGSKVLPPDEGEHTRAPTAPNRDAATTAGNRRDGLRTLLLPVKYKLARR